MLETPIKVAEIAAVDVSDLVPVHSHCKAAEYR